MNLSRDLQDRLDNIMLLMKEKQSPIEKIIQKPIELVPNNPFLNYEKIDEEIETKVFTLMIVKLIIIVNFRLYLLTIEKILK